MKNRDLFNRRDMGRPCKCLLDCENFLDNSYDPRKKIHDNCKVEHDRVRRELTQELKTQGKLSTRKTYYAKLKIRYPDFLAESITATWGWKDAGYKASSTLILEQVRILSQKKEKPYRILNAIRPLLVEDIEKVEGLAGYFTQSRDVK